MTEAQIRSKRKIIEKQIAKRVGIFERANQKVIRTREQWNKALTKLYNLRAKCKHKFSFQNKPTVMGRGICKICGENDY